MKEVQGLKENGHFNFLEMEAYIIHDAFTRIKEKYNNDYDEFHILAEKHINECEICKNWAFAVQDMENNPEEYTTH